MTGIAGLKDAKDRLLTLGVSQARRINTGDSSRFIAALTQTVVIAAFLLPWQAASGALIQEHAPFTNESVITASTNRALVISMADLDDKHRLKAGDRVSFRILEETDEPSRQLVVTESGELELLSYLGRVGAEGKTCKQLAHEIKKILDQDFYQNANVIVSLDGANKMSSRARVYLIGEVRSQGALELPTDEKLTVSKAILSAGNFGQFADRKKVRVTRKSAATNAPPQIFIVNVAKVWEEGRADLDLVLEPEDTIFVDTKFWNLK